MDALSLLLRARLRNRRAWLALCLLVALLSGLVLAAVSAGHRTATAFPGFAAAHGYDAFVLTTAPAPVATLPGVTSVTQLRQVAVGTPACACARPINPAFFNLDEVTQADLPRMAKLVAGRMPDPSSPDEVLASFRLQQDAGVGVGTVIKVPLYAAAQRGAVLSGVPVTPAGPTVTLRVVGVEASEVEFPFTSTPADSVYTTPAFATLTAGRTVAFPMYFVKLRGGAAAFPGFQARVRALGAVAASDMGTAVSAIGASIWPQVFGWWLLAGLIGLAGLVVVAQGLARQAAADAEAYGTLAALGASRRQLVTVGLAATLLVAVAGAVIGVALAFLLSPLTPVGEARVADLSPGFGFDTIVLIPGACIAVLVVLAVGAWPAARTARHAAAARTAEAGRSARPSWITQALSGGGAPPSALIGIRQALERGRGRDAVPARTALLGSVLAVTALAAVVVFGASLSHLTSTPALYGQPFDMSLSPDAGPGSPAAVAALVRSLEQDREISAVSVGGGGDVMIDGRVVVAVAGAALRGPLLVELSGGRLPRTASEVALGAATMRQLGAHVGSRVRVTAPKPTGGSRTFWSVVTGTAVFSNDWGTGGLGNGAAFTLDGLLSPQCGPLPAGTAQDTCRLRAVLAVGGDLLVRAAPGPGGQAELAGLARAYPTEVTFPLPPTNLVNFGETNFPWLFGLAVAAFGIGTLLHALVVSVGRRRREVGLLKVLGFVRRQAALVVCWQTTAVAVVGLIIGIPLGIAAGRLGWGLFADDLGFVAVPVVVIWGLAALAAATVAAANLFAIGPAVAAARTRPASLLRAE